MPIDLSDAYTKLDRARDHIADVDRRITDYLASDFYDITIETNNAAAGLRVDLQSLHEPDKIINAVIGDAIGNLRSVLDYATVAVVQPITGKSSGIGFPFADDEGGFKGEVAKAAFSVCSQAVQDHLINEVQAYRGGKGNTFWALNKLRNIDKHRLLLTATQLAGVSYSFRIPEHNVIAEDCFASFKAGEKHTALRVSGGRVEFTKEPTPTFEVDIEEPGVLEHTPAMTFLQAATKDTESFLDALKIL